MPEFLIGYDVSSNQSRIRGGVSAAPLDDLFVSAVTIVGSKSLKWNADGGGDIGGASANRPNNIYAVTAVYAAGQAVVKATDSAGGDLGGTYPSPSVAKIQGYAVLNHAPADGETLIWVAGNSRYEPGVSAGTGIPNPGTRITNDLLQYTSGGAWDAVGGAVGDPVLGILYTAGVTIVGSAKHLLWNTDNASDIGASGATRPRTIYAATSIYQGTNQVLDASLGGTKNTNDLLQWTGSAWAAVGYDATDRIQGAIYFNGPLCINTNSVGLNFGGTSNQWITWSTDGAGGIGGSGSGRPDAVYVKTRLNLNSGTTEPATLVEGDFWYQSGHLKYRDGTLARHTNPGRLGKKYYSGTVAAASGEVTILSYCWAAGELDNDRSLLRAKILAVGDTNSYIRVKTYYTTNGGAGWNGLLSVDGVGTVTFSLFDLIVASYPSNTNYCTHWWRGLNFTESANGLYNIGVNWFAGSGSNYGIKITLENRTGGATFNVRAWLYEDRTPTA